MKQIDWGYHYQIIPECPEDVAALRAEHPHLWPFESVCIAKLQQFPYPHHANPLPIDRAIIRGVKHG
jgi:hypothetical protein